MQHANVAATEALDPEGRHLTTGIGGARPRFRHSFEGRR
jgi:hypothetical protein